MARRLRAFGQRVEAGERDALRPLGRRLVELVSDYLDRRRPRSVVELEVAKA